MQKRRTTKRVQKKAAPAICEQPEVVKIEDLTKTDEIPEDLPNYRDDFQMFQLNKGPFFVEEVYAMQVFSGTLLRFVYISNNTVSCNVVFVPDVQPNFETRKLQFMRR